MSHYPPPPTPHLRRRGNDASGYGQAPPNLHQAFMRTDPRQAFSDRSKSSSDSRSSGRQASEQATDEHGRRPRLTIQLPTPKSSPESEILQSPRDLARLSPVDAETALVDRFRKPVSKVSHPACLTLPVSPPDNVVLRGMRKKLTQMKNKPIMHTGPSLPAHESQTEILRPWIWPQDSCFSRRFRLASTPTLTLVILAGVCNPQRPP